MTFVVDASVAAKWLISERDSELAVKFLAEDLIAPAILRLECANALIRRLRMNELSADQTKLRLSDIATLPVRLYPFDEAGAFQLGVILRHPVYDCGYLALARAEGVQLVTADTHFRDKVVDAGFGAHVRMMDA